MNPAAFASARCGAPLPQPAAAALLLLADLAVRGLLLLADLAVRGVQLRRAGRRLLVRGTFTRVDLANLETHRAELLDGAGLPSLVGPATGWTVVGRARQ